MVKKIIVLLLIGAAVCAQYWPSPSTATLTFGSSSTADTAAAAKNIDTAMGPPLDLAGAQNLRFYIVAREDTALTGDTVFAFFRTFFVTLSGDTVDYWYSLDTLLASDSAWSHMHLPCYDSLLLPLGQFAFVRWDSNEAAFGELDSNDYNIEFEGYLFKEWR